MPRNALVTGATGGLGFETARQLALQRNELGYTHVILSGRSQAKADAAAQRVAEEGPSPDFFSGVAIDLGSAESVAAAVEDLSSRNIQLHSLILNAGLVPDKRFHTSDGIEFSMAASVIGHHRLIAGLLHANVLAPDCRIVLAGSEAARGVFQMSPIDIAKLANGGSVEDIERLIRSPESDKFNGLTQYANTKLVQALYVQQVAKLLPKGMRIVCVSPGATGGTHAGRAASGILKLMVFLMNKAPALFGAHTVREGSQRYIDGLELPASESGKFYASRFGLLRRLNAIGPIVDNGSYYQLQNKDLPPRVLAAVEKVANVALVQ